MPDEIQEVNPPAAESAPPAEDRPPEPEAERPPEPEAERPPEPPPRRPPVNYSLAFSILRTGLRTSFRAFAAVLRGDPCYQDPQAATAQLASTIQQQSEAALLVSTQNLAQKLREDLERKSAEAEEYREQIRRLKSGLRAQSEASAEAETRAQSQAERDAGEIRQYIADNAALRDDLARAQAELASRARDMSDLQARVSELESEAARQRESAAAAEQARRGHEEAATAALEAAHGEAHELNAVLQSREEEIRNLQAALDERDHAALADRQAAEHAATELRDRLRGAGDAAARAEAQSRDLQESLRQLQHEMEQWRDKAARAEGLERQLAHKSEESQMLRDDLLAQRRALAELQAQASGSQDATGKQAYLKGELERKGMQMEAMGEQLSRLNLRAEKLEVTMREFYLQAIDPVTVAAASAELLATVGKMSEKERENFEAIRKNLDLVLQAMKEFVSQMNGLGINPGSRS